MKKYHSIKFYANRKNKGATGGPGGVLYLQKSILGNKFKGIPLRFVFESKNKFIKMFKNIYVRGILHVFFNELFALNNYYICNDIETAFVLAFLNKKYTLIYHQQGPSLEERKNFGVRVNSIEALFIKFLERVAFTNAEQLSFPSSGAKEIYFSSEYRTCELYEVNIGKILPNTIEIEEKEMEMETEIVKELEVLTFLSVGTITKAKGQDNTIKFLRNFASKYDKPFRYIMVGGGAMAFEVINEARNLEKEFVNFKFIYVARCSHSEIIRLNKISDIYIMLHRISIFDLATLEAMSQASAIILSDVGGNKEFNIDDNVILVDLDNIAASVEKLLEVNINELKMKNKDVFIKNFTVKNFKENYSKLLETICLSDV